MFTSQTQSKGSCSRTKSFKDSEPLLQIRASLVLYKGKECIPLSNNDPPLIITPSLHLPTRTMYWLRDPAPPLSSSKEKWMPKHRHRQSLKDTQELLSLINATMICHFRGRVIVCMQKWHKILTNVWRLLVGSEGAQEWFQQWLSTGKKVWWEIS